MSGLVSTTNAPAAPEATGLGLSEHDKAMIAKVDGASGAPAPAADAPPANEQKPAEGAATQPETKAELPPQAATKEAITEVATGAAEAAKAAGGDTSKVDFNALTEEYAANGKLSDEAYTKLEAAGLGKETVDQFIEGRLAVANQQIAEAYALVGGKDQYAVMIDWATKNMPAADQAAFDKAVVGDAATRTMALKALKAEYEAAVGRDPSLIRPGSSVVKATAGSYQSRAEVTADMRNPKYRSDPAFRAEVERKLANSNVF